MHFICHSRSGEMCCTEGMCKYRNHTNHTGLNQHKVVTVLDDNKNDYFLDRLWTTI